MISIRKIGVISRRYRHLNRYRQILAVLFKYGFGDLVDLLKIEQYIEIGLQMISRKDRQRVERHSRAERLRMAVEELGTTFIKLGQILSTRPDLVPVELVRELSKLQDQVPASSFSDIAQVIQAEIRLPMDEIFESFDETPIASASIGQVHGARLKEGERVAVKVQRPGIRKQVEVDLEIMLHLAMLMERHIEELSLHHPVKIVEEFARIIGNEMDFCIEAANMDRFAQQFLGDPTVYVPKVFPEWSTSLVLTMEFVDGVKVSDLEGLESRGYDPRIITQRGADILLKQVFEIGFFHADPHPGNIFVLANNVICLLDFGMMGNVDRQRREYFVDLIDGVVRRDPQGVTQALLKATLSESEPDIPRLEEDVGDFIHQHLYRPLREIKMGKLLHRFIELVSRHRLRLSPDIFLMMKALSTVEGVALMLDPQFDMIEKAKPYVERVKRDRYSPRRLADDVFRLAGDWYGFMQQLPRDVLEIIRMIRQGKIIVDVEHKGFETLLLTHDQISNRISFSIIIAALLIGSALIVRSGTPPLFYGISLIGIIGFTAAAVMGIWLLVAILKKGRL